MAAWSPVTGDIVAFGGLAVISGCEAGVRWGTEVPDGGTGSIFVRENGEVVVSTYRHSWVLDGVTGEPLRDAAIGTSGDFGDLGKGVAYHPDCGLLVQSSPSSWFWMDLDSLSRGPRLAVDPERAGTDNWSGTPDCGLAVGMMRLARDGSVQYDVPVPSDFYPEFFTMASPPVPLADGGIAVISDPPGWFRIAPDGAITDQHMMDLSIVGLRNASEPLLAPDGTLHYMTASGGEYRASATATGLVPGPFLWPNSGRNWARTNSVLPDE